MSISEDSSSSEQDLDPLLKDLNEKKHSFRRNVLCLAAELKDVRSRLASQEELFTREALTRQVAETRARTMEEEMVRLQTSLEERNKQLRASASNAQQYLKQLDELRVKLSAIQETSNASAASAQSAQLQCLALSKELDVKNNSLKEHENRVNSPGEQLEHLRRSLQAREASQMQPRDEVIRVEKEIMQAVVKDGANQDCELRWILEEVSPKKIKKMNKLLSSKDEEIAKPRDEIRIMSAHWKLKTKKLESQMQKFKKTDQELKKRVLKLEFWVQEARSQNRKLQRVLNRREKDLKALRDQLATKKLESCSNTEKQANFWESSGFKFVASMSMLVLVVFAK
ncbi:hypothetical protein Sjap_007166 [Stephania japonica]|uniref:Uncharacterized protein n=1 Tax=Stephania japonica TaxID=461633 RepID=A0AAP0JM79_9MAGN